MMDSDEEEEWSKPVEEVVKDTNRPYVKQNTGSHSRVILHIDIDCFYAQVEMLRNPELKNKPLGIQQKYIIVTCNYVARERGLTKLMTVKDAREKCPDLVLVSGEDLTNYRNMSYKISNYLQKYCQLVERLGFDENFLDITNLVNDRINSGHDLCPTEVKGHVYMDESYRSRTCSCGCLARLIMGSHIAAEIRAGLLKELGITCCAGIAHNKLLSKLVAGTHKPNQQTTLFPDDVKVLMSRLNSVRSIQGIGHTTARRLKDLGVVTVVDLQNIEESLLEEEFGHLSAETMRKLSLGIDDSSVIAFGLPQTLSDEDSFKKCSDQHDAQARIKQLINSLLHRLLEDGRRPQTLRLTIRRMSDTNRYNNRESRQCNIPPAVFNKFSTDNHAFSSSQLEVLAYSLFTKMVDTKSPFHLTLINVAFSKLEQKSSNDISNFFSAAGSPQCTYTNMRTETASNNNQSSIAKEGKVKSPSMKRVSGIQKWLVQQPMEHSNTCKDEFAPVRSSSKNFEILDKQHVSGYKTCKASKRLSSDRTCDINEENFIKRARSNTAQENHVLPENVEAVLPADLDLDVFHELPPHIQNDVLQNVSHRDISAACNKGGQKKETNTSLKACPESKNLTFSKIQYKPTSSSGSSNICVSAEVENADTERAGKFMKLKNTCSDLQIDKSALDSKQFTGSNHMEQTITDTSHYKAQSPLASNKTLDRLVTEQSKDSESENFTIPPDIDATVFTSLPKEIKQELIQQWKSEKEIKTKNEVNTKRHDNHYFRSPKPSATSSITDYFPKKT